MLVKKETRLLHKIFGDRNPVLSPRKVGFQLLLVATLFAAGWIACIMFLSQEGTLARTMLLVGFFGGQLEGLGMGVWTGYTEFRDSTNRTSGRRVSSAMTSFKSAAGIAGGIIALCFVANIIVIGSFTLLGWDNIVGAVICYVLLTALGLATCMEIIVAAFDDVE